MTFFYVEFVNVKVGWKLVESNGVSMISENCKKIPMNIINVLQIVIYFIVIFVMLNAL